MMSISHCYCSDYMTKPTQFGDEPKKYSSFAYFFLTQKSQKYAEKE